MLSIHDVLRRPTEDEVAAWMELAPKLEAHAERVYAIVEEPGLIGSIMRSAINSVLILKGVTRMVSVHSSLVEAPGTIARAHRIPLHELVRGAQANGLLPGGAAVA